MNDTPARLCAVAYYIQKFDVPELLAVEFRTDGVDFHGHSEEHEIATFLRWADTLGGDVEMTVHKSEYYHLHAVGFLPGTDIAAKLKVLVVPRAERDALEEEFGRPAQPVAITRAQLAKIADPELLDDRPFLTEEQKAEIEHWSNTPMPHEVTS